MTRVLRFLAVAAVAAPLSLATTAHGQIVELLPGDISGGSGETSSFTSTDSLLTLTPFIGATQATFNNNATRLGIDDQGTNANAFNDPDTDPANGNEELLQFELSGGAALFGFAFDFSRADGPGDDDGVIITGLNPGVDPGIVFSPAAGDLFAVYDGVSSVRLNLGVTSSFVGPDVVVTFTNQLATVDSTLVFRTTDTTQAGAQLAVTGISYEASPGNVNVGVDSVVTEADFFIIRDNFFATEATREQGDLTGDGVVDIADFNVWKDFFPGNGAALAPLLFSSVPEPATATMVLCAAAGLAARRRR